MEGGSIHGEAVAAEPTIAFTRAEVDALSPLPHDVVPSEEYEAKLAQREYSEENRLVRRARWQEEAEERRKAREERLLTMNPGGGDHPHGKKEGDK